MFEDKLIIQLELPSYLVTSFNYTNLQEIHYYPNFQILFWNKYVLNLNLSLIGSELRFSIR